MEAYRSDSYGEAFADVYDEWYRDLDDVESVVAFVTGELAASGDSGGTGRGNPALLELGVGTGRLALPFATAGGASRASTPAGRCSIDWRPRIRPPP
ncbi:MAG: hypothetical protein WKF58_04010 [Ilumatobacteraceae bacterium]